jgi:putative aldouronate transport system substrate-binding protein
MNVKNLRQKVSMTLALIFSCVVLLTGVNTAFAKTKAAPVELTWYTIGGSPKDLKKVNDKINEYTKKKLNVVINMKFIDWGDYTKKMQVMINSGENFDICFTCSWANEYLPNVRKGAFVALDGYLNKYGKATLKAIDPGFWEGAKVDGKTYAIPTNKELAVAPSWVMTKSLVDKYKIDITKIKKMEDVEPVLKKIKSGEGADMVPFYLTKDYTPIVSFDKLSGPLGVSLNNKNLKIESIYENKDMVNALKLLHKWYKLGYINQDAATTQDDKSVKRFLTKGDGQPYADNIWSKDLGYKVVSTPIIKPYISNGSATGAMQAVSVTSKHKIEAVKFLDLLNTDKYLRNLVNYGIEGVHYNKLSANKIKLKDDSKNYQVPYFSLQNLFLTYVLDNDPDNKWKEFTKFNANSMKSPALGFNFDNSKVQTEMSAFDNIVNEFNANLFTGTVDPDEWLPKINAKLKEAGIDKVKAEMQKQINAWKAKNKKY